METNTPPGPTDPDETAIPTDEDGNSDLPPNDGADDSGEDGDEGGNEGGDGK